MEIIMKFIIDFCLDILLAYSIISFQPFFIPPDELDPCGTVELPPSSLISIVKTIGFTIGKGTN